MDWVGPLADLSSPLLLFNNTPPTTYAGGGGNRAWRTPQEVYATLETLLPGAFATNDGGDGGGGFLELWAPADAAHARPGWVHVAEGGGGGGEAAG